MSPTDSKTPQQLTLVSDKDYSCAHCGLPVPSHRKGTEVSFCCNGCASVFAILNESGLGKSYYDLRRSTGNRDSGSRPSQRANEHLLIELDSEMFAESHTSVLENGFVRTHLYLDGVHCAACVWLIEQLPKELNGIRSAQLNLPRSRLSLEWQPEKIQLSAIARWLWRYGYGVEPRIDGEEAKETREERKLLIQMGISWALAGNIMLLAFAMYAGLSPDSTGLFEAARWVSFALAIPVLIIGGGVFFRKAFQSLMLSFRLRSVQNLHMDLPISLGILVGFVSSGWATITGRGEVWFDSIGILIAALLTARWIQLRARRLAGNSTEQLLAILPSTAHQEDSAGGLTSVRTENLKPGDVVIVKPGELIPVDGILLSSGSLINTSVLTGESVPIRKTRGDQVFAGTTNETDRIHIQVQSVGVQSNVGRLVSWASKNVGEGSYQSGWISVLGSWFTVAVISTSVVAGLYWWIADPSQLAPVIVSLLVITCPCALGMAAPLALAVGTGKAARKGIFIKSESVFDWLNKVDVVVLDKTGTLTWGKMSIVEIAGSDSVADIEIPMEMELAMKMASALESDSVHPIGRAFQTWSEGRILPSSESTIHAPSKGIEGFVGKTKVRVGNLEWIPLQEGRLKEHSERMLGLGQVVIAVEINGIPSCVVALDDPLRSNASELIRHIQDSGKHVVLCSGDNSETTVRVGAQIGLFPEACLGNFDPNMKMGLIQDFISKGRIVAMIGDGVNDSGALQAAHVGVAVTEGTAASRFAADAFTTRSGLEAIIELFQESGKIIRVIDRNLVFSLGYNILGASLAVMGLVNPMFAAIAMPVSSLIVVSSSVMQRTFVKRTNS
jgi:P-type Cu2+ transporter